MPRTNRRTVKISRVKKEIGYELHKPARKKYLRRHVVLHGFKDLFEADLIDLNSYGEKNRGYKYILLVICCFSKYVFTRPLKTKSGLEQTEAMRSILLSREKSFLKPPKFIHVDRGGEFYCEPMKKLMSDLNINMYSTGSKIKASMAERAIRTVKTILFREFSIRGSYKWIDILKNIIRQYNNSYHRTIKMPPSMVTPEDESYLQSIHNSNQVDTKIGKIKFQVGDIVRISKIKAIFDKGYLPNWSTELFEITEVCKTRPVTYKLKDLHGQPVTGGFYNEELQKTRHPDVYLIEKVLKRQGNRHFVKFLGFPNSENAWITVNNYV